MITNKTVALEAVKQDGCSIQYTKFIDDISFQWILQDIKHRKFIFDMPKDIFMNFN
jgi:hypothetical protein